MKLQLQMFSNESNQQFKHAAWSSGVTESHLNFEGGRCVEYQCHQELLEVRVTIAAPKHRVTVGKTRSNYKK